MDEKTIAGAKPTHPSPTPTVSTKHRDFEREIERETTNNEMANHGWQLLPEEKKKAGGSSGGGRDSADVVTIELGETGLSNSVSNAGILKDASAMDGTTDAGDGDAHVPPLGEYMVYKRRWFGLVQLILLNMITSWDGFTFSPVAAHSARYFGVDENTVNWLTTAFLFAFTFMTPAVIYVLHRGPKLSIMISAGLVLVGNWIRYAGSHSLSGGNYGVVMFGQILIGLAQPFVLAAPTRYSDLWFTNRGRVGATAIASLANPFGAALGQLIVPFWVTQTSDVSSMVLYVSAIATACALPAFFIPAKPPTPAAPSSETPKLSLRQSIKVLLPCLEFWLLIIPFTVYVGLFNSVSSLLNQIMAPYGYTEEESGIGGAILIVVGLVTAAATSPIIDRTKAFLTTVRICVPLVGLCLLVFTWMPETKSSGGVAGPYIILAIFGAAAFSLVPVAIEFMVEVTHPVSPEVTSTLAWSAGQLLAGIFIVISGALKDGSDADPPHNMKRALIFSAVMGVVVVPVPLCLGLFGRKENIRLRRVRSDELGAHVAREGEIRL